MRKRLKVPYKEGILPPDCLCTCAATSTFLWPPACHPSLKIFHLLSSSSLYFQHPQSHEFIHLSLFQSLSLHTHTYAHTHTYTDRHTYVSSICSISEEPWLIHWVYTKSFLSTQVNALWIMSFFNVSGWNRHKFSAPCDL